MHKTLICALATTLSASVFAGCATNDPAPTARDAAPAEAAADASSDRAVNVLQRGGDFRFSLRDSGIRTKIEAACNEESDPAACMEAKQVAAAGEGVRFLPEEDGRLRFVSYVTEGGEEKTHLEAIVTLSAHAPGVAKVTVVEMIEGPELPPGATPLIEVADDDTIAMAKQPGTDPREEATRLVFHRASR